MDVTQAFENIRTVCRAYVGTYVEHCQIKNHLEVITKRVNTSDVDSGETIYANFEAIARIVTETRANAATHDQLELSLQTVAEHALTDQEYKQMFGTEKPTHQS